MYNLPVNTKVQSYDKDGYYVMPMCGIISAILPEGHVIIKSFDGYFYSSVSFGIRVSEIEVL